jgi:hypothetical protein
MSILSINGRLTAIGHASPNDALPVSPPFERPLASESPRNEALKTALQELRPEELRSLSQVIDVLRKEKEQDVSTEERVCISSLVRFTSLKPTNLR